MPLKLAEDGRNRWRSVNHTVELRDAHGDADERGNDDADEHSALHIEDYEHAGQHQTDGGQDHWHLRIVAKGYGGGIAANDDAGTLETDEGNVETDAYANGILQCAGY